MLKEIAIIPHMSLELAVRISMVNESMIRYALMDLIAKPEMDSFCERLNLLKLAIRKEFEKETNDSKKETNNSKFVAKKDWGKDNILMDFLTGIAENKNSKEKDGTANYIGRFVEEFAGVTAYNKGE